MLSKCIEFQSNLLENYTESTTTCKYILEQNVARALIAEIKKIF